MIENKSELKRLIEITAQKTHIQTEYLEKDYYLTVILAKINDLCADLVFKGGTCLNKVYFDYHRLSEDLDFSLEFRQPTKTEKKAGISPRKVVLKKIETDMPSFVEQFQLKFVELTKRDGSRQHNYVFEYTPIFASNKIKPTIKFEIRSRGNNIILRPETREVKHKFLNPFSNEPVFEFPKVKVYALKELLADKLAACINRHAPRDFYDINFAVENKFTFNDKEFIDLFKAKLKDDGNDTDIKKYAKNLGLTQEIIKSVQEKVQPELYPVLNLSEQKKFDLSGALNKINLIFEKMAQKS